MALERAQGGPQMPEVPGSGSGRYARGWTGGHEAQNEAEHGRADARARIDELRVLIEMQLLDDGKRDVLRIQDLDLSVDRGGIDRQIAEGLLLLKELGFVRVDHQHGVAGKPRRRRDDVDGGERQNEHDREGDDGEPPPHEANDRRVKFSRGDEFRRRSARFGQRPRLIDLEHLGPCLTKPRSVRSFVRRSPGCLDTTDRTDGPASGAKDPSHNPRIIDLNI